MMREYFRSGANCVRVNRNGVLQLARVASRVDRKHWNAICLRGAEDAQVALE